MASMLMPVSCATCPILAVWLTTLFAPISRIQSGSKSRVKCSFERTSADLAAYAQPSGQVSRLQWDSGILVAVELLTSIGGCFSIECASVLSVSPHVPYRKRAEIENAAS